MVPVLLLINYRNENQINTERKNTMKTILIIDDEYYFRQALIKYILAFQEEYLVIGEANNGKTGIQKIKELHPDIILIDITMPQMNGFEVIEYVKYNNRASKFIIISGYDKFEYAQKAIQLGVQDFLLKPITRDNLYACLNKVSNLIDIEKEREHHLTKLSQIQYSSKSYLRAYLASQLIQENYELENLNTLAKEANFPLTKDYYAVLLFHVRELPSTWKQEDIELYYFTINNMVGDLLDPSVGFISFTNMQKSLCLILAMDTLHYNNYQIWLTEMFMQITSIINKNDGYIISAGTCYSALEGIHSSYIEAVSIEQYCLFYETYGIHYYSENSLKMSDSAKVLVTEEFKRQLLLAMRQNNKTYINNLIDTIFDTLRLSKLFPDTFLLQINNILLIIIDFATEYGIEKTLDSLHNFAVSKLLTIYSISEIERHILDIIFFTVEQAQSTASPSNHKIIRKIKEYININYINPNLNLEIISQTIDMNLQHMCFLFKKYTDVTIGNYILQIRMEKAKDLLLNSTDNISQIAEKVGFEDVGYFSKCFKKYYGVSPKNYITKYLCKSH